MCVDLSWGSYEQFLFSLLGALLRISTLWDLLNVSIGRRDMKLCRSIMHDVSSITYRVEGGGEPEEWMAE